MTMRQFNSRSMPKFKMKIVCLFPCIYIYITEGLEMEKYQSYIGWPSVLRWPYNVFNARCVCCWYPAGAKSPYTYFCKIDVWIWIRYVQIVQSDKGQLRFVSWFRNRLVSSIALPERCSFRFFCFRYRLKMIRKQACDHLPARRATNRESARARAVRFHRSRSPRLMQCLSVWWRRRSHSTRRPPRNNVDNLIIMIFFFFFRRAQFLIDFFSNDVDDKKKKKDDRYYLSIFFRPNRRHRLFPSQFLFFGLNSFDGCQDGALSYTHLILFFLALFLCLFIFSPFLLRLSALVCDGGWVRTQRWKETGKIEC